MADTRDILYEGVLARIADRTVTADDFNKLISEALGKSVRERVNRHQRPAAVEPAAADPRPTPHRQGDNDPTRTARGRMANRGARKERENELQRRRVAAEADTFLRTHAAASLAAAVAPLRAVADLPALRSHVAGLLADQAGRQIWQEQHLPAGTALRTDWLYGLLRVADVLLTEAGRPPLGELGRKLMKLRPQLASAAQTVYDTWEQDADGVDEELGSGGICNDVADAMAGVLAESGIDASTFWDQYDEHARVVAWNDQEAYVVDIPYGTYESGGGYSWTKLADVNFESEDVSVAPLDYGILPELLSEEARPVRIEQESLTTWVCPHCSDRIHEKSLYHDGSDFFHRPCRGAGPISLPISGGM